MKARRSGLRAAVRVVAALPAGWLAGVGPSWSASRSGRLEGAPPAGVVFEVLASTRSVTRLAEIDGTLLVGTTGGLVEIPVPALEGGPGSWPVRLPGVPVRELAAVPGAVLVATDRGLFRRSGGQGWDMVSAEPAAGALGTAAGSLWTGHGDGAVVRRDPTGSERARIRTGWRAPVHSLVEDGDGVLVASVEGLARIGPDGKAVTERPGDDPLATTVMRLVRIGTRVLALTAGGVFEREGGVWVRRGVGATASIHALDAVASGDSILVATAGDSLHRLEGTALTRVARSFAHASALVRVGRHLVVGLPMDGTWVMGSPPRPLQDLDREPPGNTVTGLAFAARYRTLVVGTFENGLGMFQDGAWRQYGEGRGLPSNWVNQVASDGTRVLVRFSDGRVYTQIGRERFRQLGAGDHWPKNWTSSLGVSDGSIWVGTLSAYYLRNPGGWDVVVPKPELQDNQVTDLERMGPETWVATHKHGLHRHDRAGDRWDSYGYGSGLGDAWVTCVEGFRGEVWAGTFDGGVARLGGTPETRQASAEARHPERWRRYRAADPDPVLPTDAVNAMLATPEELWIATQRGLVRTDGTRWTRFGLDEGLPSDEILSLASDGERLWIGTSSGLCQAPLALLREAR